MIVRMKRVFAAARAPRAEALMEVLRRAGVLHVEPVKAVPPPEAALGALGQVQRALQALEPVAPEGAAPAVPPREAAAEVLAIVQRLEEGRQRIATLAREAEGLALWGDLRRAELEALAAAGVAVRFYLVPRRSLDKVRAELALPLADAAGGMALVGVVQRAGEPAIPEDAQRIEPPRRGRGEVQEEARRLDASIESDRRRLGALAGLRAALEKEKRALEDQARFEAALAGSWRGEDLFAVQGWVPEDATGRLSEAAEGSGAACLVVRDPLEEEAPPTLIRYSPWVKPMKGMFDILMLSPGYREVDLAPMFMLSLPLFMAMILGDFCYGAIYALVPLVFFRRTCALLGKQFTILLAILGAATAVWGLLIGSYFGVGIADMEKAGGVWALLGGFLGKVQFISVDLSDASVRWLMSFCFLIAAVHLSLAHLRKATALFPDLSFLGQVGWAAFLWGMSGVLRWLLLHDMRPEASPLRPGSPYLWLLLAGAALAIAFASPSRNVLKALAVGLGNFPLSVLSTFSDSMSYIRLMALGVTGGVLAASFNQLAAQAGAAMAVPLLVLGHGLNMALCLISLFSQAVRLCVLEFSSNVGMEWSGVPYDPLARTSG